MRQPHCLFDLAVPPILPDQQIRDSARIAQIPSHKPGRDDGHAFTVEPRPETEEIAVPSVALSSLFHRLIPVTAFSIKVPLRGRVFKESIKVCTPKSPAFSDDFAPDLFADSPGKYATPNLNRGCD